MRPIFLLLLTLYFLSATGQKLAYLNDSLYVNNFYVEAQTSRSTLDSLLNSKSKIKTSKSSFRNNPATGKKVIETTAYYYDLGLFFRRYDYDTTKLSIGIKLYRDTDPKEDKGNGLTKPFKGQLYIADNYINDKRTIEQLGQLKNCTVTVDYASVGSYSSNIGGDIVYQQSVIRIVFDTKTNELKSVFIHHNLKDR